MAHIWLICVLRGYPVVVVCAVKKGSGLKTREAKTVTADEYALNIYPALRCATSVWAVGK